MSARVLIIACLSFFLDKTDLSLASACTPCSRAIIIIKAVLEVITKKPDVLFTSVLSRPQKPTAFPAVF